MVFKIPRTTLATISCKTTLYYVADSLGTLKARAISNWFYTGEAKNVFVQTISYLGIFKINHKTQMKESCEAVHNT